MNLKLNEYIIDVNILEIKDAKARDEHLLVKLKELDPNAKPAENPKYYEVEIDGWIFWVDRESYEIKKKDDQEIIIGQGAIIFKDLKWNNEEAEVTIEKTTNDNLQLQYKIDDGEYKLIESGSKITNLKLGNLVTARLWDGTNGRNTASINVQDITNPTEAIIEFENAELIVKSEIQAKIIQNDNESGVDIEKSKWVYNTISESIGLDENSYTGGTFKTKTETISLTAETEGTYYLHILTVDKAGNKTETISNAVIIKSESGTGVKDAITVEGENLKGAFIRYDVEYTDVIKYVNYEYSNIDGWRLMDYDIESDGKTLKNVKLISTGIPAYMYYNYYDTQKNYTKWLELDDEKIGSFKNSVLGNNYTLYTGNEKYYALQASAGFYYNLGQMTFEQGTSYTTKNQGYYTKVKNGNVTYTSGEFIGDKLFKARDDAKVRMLTLPELNKGIGREDIDSLDGYDDTTGLYRLDRIQTCTPLKKNNYYSGLYWIASPLPNTGYYSYVCKTYFNGGSMWGEQDYSEGGVRPVIEISSKVQLIKKTDDTGFVYYKMMNMENTQDTTSPDKAVIQTDTTKATLENTTIMATITQNDDESGVDIAKCKWVYNTISESIGLDENSYTGGTFKTTTETISLTAETEGTYYLHILTIDKAGNKTETISRPLSVTYKGIFAKYDVEYTDIYMNYEYTNTNGWRILDYDFDKDKKTLTNVKLISTGIPAKMYYYYKGTKKNYTKWITDSTKLSEFKNNVLGTDYTTYTGNATYYGLQASAGFYYNLNQMTFEQGTSASTQNQGYYKKVKNKDTTYTSGEIVGNNLFNARDDASIRCLTLTELNNALKRENVESTNKVTNDVLGLYQLSKISTETSLINNVYDYGDYLLASPYPETNNANEIVYMDCYDNGLYSSNYGSKGIRPVICISSEVKLQKKTDDTGFEYYEMVNAN